jgi:large subunit ribosomal protein L13
LSSNKLSANKQWFLIDAEGQNLGRFSSKIAKILRGKYKTNFTPHADCGDNVVIVNASKIVMTGDKLNKREIFSHTGFPGGQKRITPSEMLAKDGTSVVRHAIKGMLPKNKLGAAILKNCYIFSEGEHDKEAQKPTSLNLNNLI